MTDRPLKSNHFWEGELPTREYDKPIFSRKIFVGGVPWDIREAALQDAFREFGACQVEWPGCEARYQGANGFQNANGKRKSGYVYIIYEDECSITQLLRECSQEVGGAGEWYFKINAQRTKSTETRQVQVIPWVTCDSTYALDKNAMALGVEPKRTVFVGALHGMITAQVLHSIMEDKFGPVECVQLDTDKYKYPIGSGRVTFRSHVSYFRAIEVGLLEVVTSKFKKRVQIDPFLEVSSCMKCKNAQAMQFCREKDCFKYYCDDCWRADHYNGSGNENHGVVNVPSLKSPRKSQNQDIITPPSSRCGSPQKQGAYFAAMSQNYEPYCYGAPQVLFKVDDQQVLDDIARTDLSMAQLYISDLNGYQHNHGHGHQFQPFIIGSPMMLPYTPMPSPPSISVADPTLGYLNMAAAYFASCGGSNGGYEVPKSQSYQYHQQPSSNGNSNTRSTASRSDPTITSAASSSSTSTYRPPAMTTSTTSTRRTPGRRPPQSYSYSRRQF